MSRWAVEFPAFHPHKSKTEWMVGIHRSRLDKIKRSGVLTPLARIVLLPDLVANPLRILQGWSRVVDSECFVYIGNPAHDVRFERIEVPPPPGMLLFVFILDDGSIDHWDWRRATSPDELPDGMNGVPIWPAST